MNKVKVREFKLDKALGYLIQNITGDSTQEILGYFYGISQFVIDDINKSSRARWLDKNVILFYKETPITYRLRISGSGPSSKYSNPSVSIDVTFPKENSSFDLTNLMDAIVESGLGLSTEEHTMPLFEKPMFKTPKALRKVRLEQEKAYEQARAKIESDESSSS